MSLQLRELNSAQNKKLKRAQILELAPEKIFDDGRTKQAFKDETDINQIMKRAQVTGTISHINKYEGRYGDFANFDFLGNQLMIAQAQTIFDELPPEMRNEFNNSPQEFFEFANDPANVDNLAERLPGLAEPGRQNLNVSGNIGADAEAARVASEQPIPETLPAAPAITPPAANEEPS